MTSINYMAFKIRLSLELVKLVQLLAALLCQVLKD